MNIRSLQIVIFAFVCLCNIGLASNAAAAVTLRTDTEVNRATVKLSDVFEGLTPGTDADIARSPAPGKSITYDANVIAHLVKQYKLDYTTQAVTDHTTITTASTKITGDDIRAAVVEKVKSLDVVGDLSVVFDSRIVELILPADRPSNFVLNNFNYDGVTKRFRADLVADSFAGPVTMPVMGHIGVHHTVPVFSKRIESGTIISATDLDYISVPDEHMSGLVTTAEELVGREVRRDLESGQPVHERDVMSPRMVVRGSLVTMKTETPYMTVTAQGRALQDGKTGETVRVINTTSNRTIEGVVVGNGTVRVQTTRIIAYAEDAAPAKQE